MTKALRSWRRRKDGKDGSDADVRPLQEQLAELRARIEKLEKVPVPLQPVNDSGLVPGAFGKLHERVDGFEERVKAAGELGISSLQAMGILNDKLTRLETNLTAKIGELEQKVTAAEQLEHRRWAEFPRELAIMQQQLSRVK